MSAEATGWVFRASPYTGAMFALHLAIADTVNDVYGNEMWMSAPTLAAKARVSERTARYGLAQMTEDGLLVLVAAKEGKARRYRFLMPSSGQVTAHRPLQSTSDTPAVAAPPPLQLAVATPAARRATPAARRATPAARRDTPAVAAPNPKKTQLIPTGSQVLSVTVDQFDDFWRAYPLRKAKGAARTAWIRALKRATPDRIITGANAYAADPNRNQDFTKHPATWLNGDCWEDEPAPAKPRLSKSTTNLAAWAERTS